MMLVVPVMTMVPFMLLVFFVLLMLVFLFELRVFSPDAFSRIGLSDRSCGEYAQADSRSQQRFDEEIHDVTPVEVLVVFLVTA